MRLKVISIGHKMPDWVNDGVLTYQKRLPREYHFELIEIPFAGKRDRHADIAKLIEKEGKKMLDAIQPQDHCIALEVTGQPWSTPQLSQQLQIWQDHTQVCLLIGGPEGLAPACQARANQTWSLSKLTLPHPLVRVVLVEQIYRAYTILCGHPYHRE